MTFSQIFGNLINTFVLDKITNFHYFLIMGSIGSNKILNKVKHLVPFCF
jgi:hypothetical protein